MGTCPGPSIITWTSRARPRSLGQLAERVELGELRGVRGVRDRSRAKAVAQRDRHVVTAADLKDLLETVIERVLALVVDHPAREQPAAAGHDPGHPMLTERQVLESNAGVDRTSRKADTAPRPDPTSSASTAAARAAAAWSSTASSNSPSRTRRCATTN